MVEHPSLHCRSLAFCASALVMTYVCPVCFWYCDSASQWKVLWTENQVGRFSTALTSHPSHPPSCTSLDLSSSTCKIKNGLQDLRVLEFQHSINLPNSSKGYAAIGMVEQEPVPPCKTPRESHMVGPNWLIVGLKFADRASVSTF